MKAKLISNEEMVNPLYLAASDRTGIQPRLTLPAGQIIDDPQAWVLCVVGKAVPADDECRSRVAQHLGDGKRKAMLSNVRKLRAANGVKQLDKNTLKWLEYMETAYASELAALDEDRPTEAPQQNPQPGGVDE